MSTNPEALTEGALYVDSDARLEDMVQQLDDSPSLAIDTEFVRERTYYPRLCLIQLASRDQIWCVDPLSIKDLTPLMELLDRVSITKVLHSARQDLEIFYHLRSNVPGPVFDTQIAAALLGRPAQIAYASLVAELFDVALDKSAVRTDWSRRPLSDVQIRYAVADVAYLAALKERLSNELESHDRMSWLTEECARLGDLSLYVTEPEAAWRRVKGANRLNREAFERLVRLASWRERTAMRRDLPRSWILKDQDLIDVAAAAPNSEAELLDATTTAHRGLKRWANEVLTALTDPDGGPATAAKPALAAPLDEVEKNLFKSVSKAVKTAADELRLEPTVISNRKEMERAVRGSRDGLLFSGWRRVIVGDGILEMLEKQRF